MAKGKYYTKAIEAYAKAIEAYTKAIELNPYLALVYINRASVFNRKGVADKVIEDCTKALEIDPKYSDAYYKRSDAYYNKGEKYKALDDYIKAMEINPSDKARDRCNRDPRFKNAYDNMIDGIYQITESERDEDDFIAGISGEIKRNQTDIESLVRRGIAYADRGDTDKAIDDFTEALRLNPTANVYYLRGHCYAEQEKFKDAINELNKAIGMQRDFLDALAERGRVYEKLGDYVNAEEDHIAIFMLDNDDTDNETKIAMYKEYESKGLYGKAEDILFELKESNNEIINDIIKLFYKKLLEKSDDELIEGNLSRNEILEELNKL